MSNKGMNRLQPAFSLCLGIAATGITGRCRPDRLDLCFWGQPDRYGQHQRLHLRSSSAVTALCARPVLQWAALDRSRHRGLRHPGDAVAVGRQQLRLWRRHHRWDRPARRNLPDARLSGAARRQRRRPERAIHRLWRRQRCAERVGFDAGARDAGRRGDGECPAGGHQPRSGGGGVHHGAEPQRSGPDTRDRSPAVRKPCSAPPTSPPRSITRLSGVLAGLEAAFPDRPDHAGRPQPVQLRRNQSGPVWPDQRQYALLQRSDRPSRHRLREPGRIPVLGQRASDRRRSPDPRRLCAGGSGGLGQGMRHAVGR